jgi:hypothetical protein
MHAAPLSLTYAIEQIVHYAPTTVELPKETHTARPAMLKQMDIFVKAHQVKGLSQRHDQIITMKRGDSKHVLLQL